MPHVLIPDGFTLKKVTKLQKEAVDAKRRHDDTIAILTNPNTPLVVGTAVATFFGVKYGEDLVSKLKEEIGDFTEDTERKVREAVQSANPLNIDLTQFVDTSDAPVKPGRITPKDLVKEFFKNLEEKRAF
jgi:hypothetical protein